MKVEASGAHIPYDMYCGPVFVATDVGRGGGAPCGTVTVALVCCGEAPASVLPQLFPVPIPAAHSVTTGQKYK